MTEPKRTPTLEERCNDAGRHATLWTLAQAGHLMIKAWAVAVLENDGDDTNQIDEIYDEWKQEDIAAGLTANAKTFSHDM
jgi:hypothetical protein